MRRILLSVIIACFALIMLQCKNNEVVNPVVPTDEMVDVTMQVVSGDGSKTDITVDGIVTWRQGDKLYVVGQNHTANNGYLGYLTAQNSGQTASFTGSISKISESQTLHFYYIGDKEFTLTDGNYVYDISSQNGKLSYADNGIARNLHLMHGSISATVGQTDLGTINMTSMMSIAKLKFSRKDGTALGTTIICEDAYNQATLNIKNGTLGSFLVGDITLSGVSAGNDFYVALIPSATEQTFSFWDDKEFSVVDQKKTIEVNKIYAGPSDGFVLDNDLLHGKFQVNSSGKMVRFTRGNVYYDNSEGKMCLEKYQCDYRIYSDKDYVNSAIINKTSTTTPEDDWGTFGWSTTTNNNYGMSISQDVEDYKGYFEDWGTATGLADNGYYTLSYNEYDYLLNNSYNVAKSIKYDGTNNLFGSIFIPDKNFNQLSNIVNYDDLKTYDAVFIPIIGMRGGKVMWAAFEKGYYWTSTPYNDYGKAYLLQYRPDQGFVFYFEDNRYIGCEVRLVKEVK